MAQGGSSGVWALRLIKDCLSSISRTLTPVVSTSQGARDRRRGSRAAAKLRGLEPR